MLFSRLSSCRPIFVGGILVLLIASPSDAADAQADVRFRRLTLSEEFHSEGADAGDFNQDGHPDVVSGPFWFAGPDFRTRHRYTAGVPHAISGYSDHFFSFVYDFNHDQHDDILVVGFPGEPAQWFENPGVAADRWKSHLAISDVGGESPELTDITGDGKPELVCVHNGKFGYASFAPQDPTRTWEFTAISTNDALGRFTHGLGVGDVDGDGQADLLETRGWHQQLDNPRTFMFRDQKFAQSGGSQMFAYDFDGDGDRDVVSVQNAHGWGLTWFERRGSGDDMLWVNHPILMDSPGDHPDNLAISQMHAMALADIDGDGVKDLVTGKRYYAHGGRDPGAFQLPVLYWFRTVRDAGVVRFEPHLIDQRVGVGTQLTVKDINGDRRNDILVGNKLGTFVLINEPANDEPANDDERLDDERTVEAIGSPPGTEAFALGVRESEPLTPEQERQTFVLPHGFEAQLVAAEPEIDKPLNMAFDDRGRLWITNTVEYPYPVEAGTPGRDSIKILEDQDGDGRAEQVTTFADGLNIPMGLYPYRDGVICFSIPYLWHLRDTDGDGKCDRRDQLYGPFDHTRDSHGLINGLTRGYDGWLYACHGFNNQSVVSGADGNQVTMHSGNTFRVKLDGSRIEHFTYGQVNPFGMTFDVDGNLLTADCHTKPVSLLMRNGCYESFGRPHDGIGFVPSLMDHLHGSTAIGGIAICTTKTTFPAVYYNNAFGGNVMTSRINRNSLVDDGGRMRAREESDFLISGDPWFRPVDLQFGPDGALYVADFYNRIIGHYEVPLDHPGRDRTSGRIWKIVYRPNEDRRDPAPQNVPKRVPELGSMQLDELVDQLDSPHLTQRMLASDRIADDFGIRASDALRNVFRTSKSIRQRIHSMWILFRVNAITPDLLDLATQAPDPLLRKHAFRLLAEFEQGTTHHVVRLLKRGLSDPDQRVMRAAVLATARHANPALAISLFDLYATVTDSAAHLKHAIRIALRDQLRDAQSFDEFTSRVHETVRTDDQWSLIAAVCISLDTPESARLVADNISKLAKADREDLGRCLQFALKYLPENSVAQVVATVRDQFPDDRAFQIRLLTTVADSLPDGTAPPPAITDWATEICRKLLALEAAFSPLPWRFIPGPNAEHQDSCWLASDRRIAADSGQAVTLWSSFPKGEHRTGTYRSAVIELPADFNFFIAGHDGIPNRPIQHKNFVRIRDAESDEILQTWNPPRNDIAQRRAWDGASKRGSKRRVYLELVDGDDGNAYAWLAVGRFSVPELNPSRLLQNRQSGAELAGRLRLGKLLDGLTMLARRTDDLATRTSIADAIARIRRDSHGKAIAAALTLTNLSAAARHRLVDSLDRTNQSFDALTSALKLASGPEQLRIGRGLVTDSAGVVTFCTLIKEGHLNAQSLLDPDIRSKLSAIASPDQLRLVESIVASLPAEQDRIEHLIARRREQFSAGSGNIERGKGLFSKHCAACHQIAGQGEPVGPNLDGIGNRGIARICEDVLAPSRNVDSAFRSHTILDENGRVLAGLVKSETDTELTVVDTDGKVHLIDKSTIVSRKQTMLSPMPGNVADLINDSEFNDLLAYLISLNR